MYIKYCYMICWGFALKLKIIALSFVLLTLILPLSLAQSQMQITETISSYGRVSYDVLINNMSNELWWGSVVSDTSWGGGSFFDADYINLFAENGATAFRVMLCKDYWDSGSPYLPGNEYRNYITNLVQSMHDVNVKCYIDLTLDGLDFIESEKAQMIVNTPDSWINWGKDVISTVHPDAISLMNEPSGTTMDQWLNFASNSILAYRDIDPDLTIFVSSMPYYSVEKPEFKDFMLSYDDKVIMEFHLYYRSDALTFDSSVENAWYSYSIGDFVEGKNQFYDYLNAKFAGFPKNRINLAEIGVANPAENPWIPNGYPTQANWELVMRDFYDYANNEGLHGLFQFNIGYKYALTSSSQALFTPYGEVFASYLQGITST